MVLRWVLVQFGYQSDCRTERGSAGCQSQLDQAAAVILIGNRRTFGESSADRYHPQLTPAPGATALGSAKERARKFQTEPVPCAVAFGVDSGKNLHYRKIYA
jgi:hypothetical protein